MTNEFDHPTPDLEGEIAMENPRLFTMELTPALRQALRYCASATPKPQQLEKAPYYGKSKFQGIQYINATKEYIQGTDGVQAHFVKNVFDIPPGLWEVSENDDKTVDFLSQNYSYYDITRQLPKIKMGEGIVVNASRLKKMLRNVEGEVAISIHTGSMGSTGRLKTIVVQSKVKGQDSYAVLAGIYYSNQLPPVNWSPLDSQEDKQQLLEQEPTVNVD